jgi:hypothetical protein
MAVSRVHHHQLGPPVPGRPEVLHGHREALGDVAAGDDDQLGLQQVGPGVAGPVDAERLLVGGRRRHHAEPPVVVDVARAQRHPGELAHQVGLLGGHAGPAEHADGVASVGGLDAPQLGHDPLQGGLPGDRVQGGVAAVAQQRGEQPVGVVDLLVGDHPLGAQPQLVDVVVARLHADHATTHHPQVHAALDPAERAVGRDQPLTRGGRLPVGGRLAAGLAAEVAGAGWHHRVAHVGGHLKPRFTPSR